ncbi:ADP-ribosyltransferase [Shewanella marisflavi]|uniref:ADP-ribosyltransferase n=1 Tax=Shewanella marisflavi TaxID=260364 RepID=UPI003AAC1C61
MIIDYKSDLLNESAALNMVDRAFMDGISELKISSTESQSRSFDQHLSNALSCIAASHKVEYANLAMPKNGKRRPVFEIREKSEKIFSDDEKSAISDYQSAAERSKIEGLKPHQYINRCLYKTGSLSAKQRKSALSAIHSLDSAFNKARTQYSLKVGQRLYRGLCLSPEEILSYINAEAEGATIPQPGYLSTSLSESIARTFAAWAWVKQFRNDPSRFNDFVEVVFVLTNRVSGQSFLQPDVLRLVNRNQGQLEVLLPRRLHLKPTYFESHNQSARIYADIVEER